MDLKYKLFIILFSIIIVYYSIQYFYTYGKIKVYAKGPINLSKQTVVIDSDAAKNLLQSKNGSTLSVYIKIDAQDKTGTYDKTPINILEQPGCWAFQYVPKSQNNFSPTYQFTINVIDSKGGESSETIPLALLPEQKWMYLTILKEGRRFDIMYNNEIIGSKVISTVMKDSNILSAYPKIQSQAIRIGHPSIRGTAAYVNGADKRYTFEEVADEWKSRADTRGQPYLSDSFSLPTIGCPNGLFCFTAPSGTGSMKKYWSSPYA
jgi:hypothetical protein